MYWLCCPVDTACMHRILSRNWTRGLQCQWRCMAGLLDWPDYSRKSEGKTGNLSDTSLWSTLWPSFSIFLPLRYFSKPHKWWTQHRPPHPGGTPLCLGEWVEQLIVGQLHMDPYKTYTSYVNIIEIVLHSCHVIITRWQLVTFYSKLFTSSDSKLCILMATLLMPKWICVIWVIEIDKTPTHQVTVVMQMPY